MTFLILVIVTISSRTLTLVPFGTLSKFSHDWPQIILGKRQSWLSVSYLPLPHPCSSHEAKGNALLSYVFTCNIKYLWEPHWVLSSRPNEENSNDPHCSTLLDKWNVAQRELKFFWGCFRITRSRESFRVCLFGWTSNPIVVPCLLKWLLKVILLLWNPQCHLHGAKFLAV